MELKIYTILIIFIAILNPIFAQTHHHDAEGLTPLHVAAGYGDLKKVKQLITNDADLFSLDSKMGVSILHKAVYSGSAEVVTYLLQEGALVDLSSPSNGNTPLHDALYFKPGTDISVVQAILKFKPNIYIKNRAGLTPKESATILKDKASLRLLEEYEKTLNSSKGRELMQAVKANDLLKAKQIVIRPEQPLEEADEQGFTPLIWAAREGFDEIVNLLLKKGVNPNQLDSWMKANAGHKAAFWGRTEAIRLLIKHGLDLNARGGYNGYTALHDAVARGHLDTVKVLIQSGAQKNIKGHDGKTAVDLARSSGNSNLLKLLWEQR